MAKATPFPPIPADAELDREFAALLVRSSACFRLGLILFMLVEGLNPRLKLQLGVFVTLGQSQASIDSFCSFFSTPFNRKHSTSQMDRSRTL